MSDVRLTIIPLSTENIGNKSHFLPVNPLRLRDYKVLYIYTDGTWGDYIGLQFYFISV